MKNQKQDRRSQRTRNLIDRAFVELMLEKSYDIITVQDIIDRANVGRSTFYAHYLDKEDLLTSQLQRLIEQLHQMPFTEASQASVASLGLFRHVEQHHQLYKALMWGKGIDMVFKIMQGILSQKIEEELARHIQNRTPAVPPIVMASFLAGGFLSLARWWLDNNMPYPPEEINRMFEMILIPVWKGYEEI